MTRHPLLDIRGPENWPEDTPIGEMTPTYAPVDKDIRYCNANLIGADEDPNAKSRLGFFHYYNDLFRRALHDHWELTGDYQLLVEAKQQTFGQNTDVTQDDCIGRCIQRVDEREWPRRVCKIVWTGSGTSRNILARCERLYGEISSKTIGRV